MAPMCQLTLELFLNFFVITFPIFKKEEKKKKRTLQAARNDKDHGTGLFSQHVVLCFSQSYSGVWSVTKMTKGSIPAFHFVLSVSSPDITS